MLKRYEPAMANDLMIEFPKGRYYAVDDVTRTMVPRPDGEAARKAVYRLEQASHMAGRELKIYGGISAGTKNELREARAAVLELMGVENA